MSEDQTEKTSRKIEWILHGIYILTIICGLTWQFAVVQSDINNLQNQGVEMRLEIKELHNVDKMLTQKLSDGAQTTAVLTTKLEGIQRTLDRIESRLEQTK